MSGSFPSIELKTGTFAAWAEALPAVRFIYVPFNYKVAIFRHFNGLTKTGHFDNIFLRYRSNNRGSTTSIERGTTPVSIYNGSPPKNKAIGILACGDSLINKKPAIPVQNLS